ncbi:conserved Plasmodium protein, unknown function [Plasmodium relictum]|uniref:Uncharacterized protein n=1 Tax=Plasmodium relictum TaxID=85471 RepID=A0A1J1HBN5_PLARL|nr:conserved Plasmodium protein, unknown function [Plasmodium relictum]CRH02868.1 conserved Plasmodium protein, unknown function [Plasmodium relictum]
MKKKKNYLLFSNLFKEKIRKKYIRNFVTVKKNYNQNNNFEILKYHDNIYNINILFYDSFRIFKDQEILLKKKISIFKNISKCNIKYFFLYLEFDKKCKEHFLNKSSQSNGIHIQILTKLNYLFILKNIIKNDTTLNRHIKYIYLNHILQNKKYNKIIFNEDFLTSRNDQHKYFNYYNNNNEKTLQNNCNKDITRISDKTKNGIVKTNIESNYIIDTHIFDNGSIKKNNDIKYFKLESFCNLFKNDYKIVIYSNINNKNIKHIYLDELDSNIDTQINYMYMFDNKLFEKSLLLQIYTFYEHFRDNIKRTNEFLFFLDRISEKILHKMNLIDLVYIFHIHTKQNYYNHLFLYILINKLENYLDTIIYTNNTEKNQVYNNIKYNQKSLIVFFHSLTNYYIYLNSVENNRHKDKLIKIKYMIYSKFSLYFLNYLENNYKSFKILDFILFYSSYLKLDIKNNFLKTILFDYINHKNYLLIQNDNNNHINIQIYSSFLNNFSKFFIQFNYDKSEYKKVIKALLILFENYFMIIEKLFIKKKDDAIIEYDKFEVNNIFNYNGNLTEKDKKNINKENILDEKYFHSNLENNFNENNILNIAVNRSINYFTLINILKRTQINEKAFKYENNSFKYENDKYHNIYDLGNINNNIKYIVNSLNSIYKIINHIIVTFNLNEFSRQFNKIYIYNFVNKVIYDKYIDYNIDYFKKISKYLYINLYTYNDININRLYICNYILNFFLCDLINAYIGDIILNISINDDYMIIKKLNENFFFSQIVSNSLGAIQNLKILRYDLIFNISYLIKKNIFDLDIIHLANLIHSFASFKIRDIELIKFLLNKLILQKDIEKHINDQSLSNIAISLLKLDYYNEAFNKIIFNNYKNIKSLQSLINITFYICYYNMIYKFLSKNYLNYFFQQINLSNINNLNMESKTQLKLISILVLFMHCNYCTQNIRDLFKKYRYIIQELQKNISKKKLIKSSDITLFKYTFKKIYNFIFIFKKKNRVKNFSILNKSYYKKKNISFNKYIRNLYSNLLYNKFLRKYKKIVSFNKYSNDTCVVNNNDTNSNYFINKHLNNNYNLTKKKEKKNLNYINLNNSLNLFDIFSYKFINNNSHRYINLINEKNYLNINFVAIFPFIEKPIYSTSNLHNQVYDIITSLNLNRRIIKELSHFPYYVDIVLI